MITEDGSKLNFQEALENLINRYSKEKVAAAYVAQNGRIRCSSLNQEVGQEWCDKLCVDAGEHD